MLVGEGEAVSETPLQMLYRARQQIDAAIATLEGQSARSVAPPTVAAVGAGGSRKRRTPEQLEAIRVDYVTETPVARVAERHGMTIGSLYMLASQQGWKRPSGTRSYYPKPAAAPAPPPLSEPAKPMPKPPPPESAPGIFKPHAVGPDLLDAEIQVRGTLSAKGYVVEHIERAVWKVNGITIDRVLFVELGYAVRTDRALPPAWLSKLAAQGVAA